MEGTEVQRLAAIGDVLGHRSEDVLRQCEAHQAYAGNNYYPFLWRFYMSHRATLFRLLRVLSLESTSQDTSLIEALHFLLHHEHDRVEWLRLTDDRRPENGAATNGALDLSWVPEKWWRLVTGESLAGGHPHRLNRRHFEVCVFSQLMWELKSGDVCIVGSDKYADYRQQLISWKEYDRMVAEYGEQVGLPVEDTTFVAHTRQWLETIAMATD